MALRRLRKLVGRTRDRLVPAAPTTGNSFDWTRDKAFAHLDEAADATFKLVNAALVSTWEITITDVARALNGRVPEDERVKLVERISDALVPTQGPLRDAERRFRDAIKAGVKAGLASGQLADATAPLPAALEGLPSALREGWNKTVEYLEPVIDRLPESATTRARFAETGAVLERLLSDENVRFTQAMAELPQSTDLKRALTGALDTWQERVCAGLESALYDRRTTLVEAAALLAQQTEPAQ